MEEPRLRHDHGRSILVVDDEAVIRDLCVRALKGYRTFQADNGETALKLLQREEIDLVLTDVMMPRMNGLDLLLAAKEREPNQAVVVMTGFTDKEIILRALRSDADDFISKPINLLHLKTTIDKVLERKALKEELVHLKRMDRLKSDFLGLISHKLKTPITAISLFIQNLAQGIGDPEDPAFQQTLAMILSESQYLGGLIQDLLNYSKIILQEGPPRLAEENLCDMVLAALAEKKDAAAAKEIRLRHTLSERCPPMLLDRQRIGFAVRMILDNAVKFTPRGGEVTVSAQVEDENIRVLVLDSGIGIPREEIPKIFEKFYQIDPDNTGQVRGFGLGLYYARQFVQSHGGRIEVESEVGRGTLVTVTLPRG
jgi:signal transduction histidine kinase